MKRTVVYDLSRLFIGPLTRTPRGIDRVDLLLARYFRVDPDTHFLGVVPTLYGMQVLDAARVGRGLDRVESLWAETTRPRDDPRMQRLLEWLTGAPGLTLGPPLPKLTLMNKIARLASLHAAVGFAPGKSAVRHIPPGSIYLSIGHYSLAYPFLMRWLDRRRDVRPVLMLHDVIPLDAPEYVSTVLARLHARMVNSVARYGAGLIVSSAHARQTVTAALSAAGRPAIPTLAARLPLAEAFDSPAEALPALDGVRYFVICGAIEPRKNHQLVLNVWRRLCAEGPDPPHLVIVGSPGWRSSVVLHMLENPGPMRGRVHHVDGLSTPALKSLLAGARALLSPTFAEGFGLPIIEAEHLGVPVVASDIPAHREVSGPDAVLIDPTDGPAWLGAVTALALRGPRHARARPMAAALGERKLYMAAIGEFLAEIAARSR
jgi:glycosyltransferase involved in cell wall biosynthesis